MPRIFFSYASDDRAKVLPVASEFEKHGIEVLIDYDQIGPGRSITASINDMIRSADGAVLFHENRSGCPTACGGEE